ncbi:uncharacterized protein BDV17DRAFT_293697 [Aspergillus undulatus]|uniref:uncharacterized protein n=1 Tax=Aspergillus undulatus TaxID=1810928 RepID=UPI003CCD697C
MDVQTEEPSGQYLSTYLRHLYPDNANTGHGLTLLLLLLSYTGATMNHTPELIRSFTEFKTEVAFLDHLIEAVLTTNNHRELVFTGVPTSLGEKAVEHVDEEAERRNTRDDIALWINGGTGAVKVVIHLNWRTNAAGNVVGDLEMYRPDRNGLPSLDQREPIFPKPAPVTARAQMINITRRELFGGNVMQGRNPDDTLPWRLDTLRDEARGALSDMGLISA